MKNVLMQDLKFHPHPPWEQDFQIVFLFIKVEEEEEEEEEEKEEDM